MGAVERKGLVGMGPADMVFQNPIDQTTVPTLKPEQKENPLNSQLLTSSKITLSKAIKYDQKKSEDCFVKCTSRLWEVLED